MDDKGALLLETDVGVGVMNDRDLERLVPHFVDVNGNALLEAALDSLIEEAGLGGAVPLWLKFRDSNVRIEPIASREAGGRFGFVARPDPPAGEEVCR
jgi:hypothetical protein